jgi:hypothetical protein
VVICSYLSSFLPSFLPSFVSFLPIRSCGCCVRMMHSCMDAWGMCMHVCIHGSVCVWMCMHVCIHGSVCVDVHAFMWVCILGCLDAPAYALMDLCMYAFRVCNASLYVWTHSRVL